MATTGTARESTKQIKKYNCSVLHCASLLRMNFSRSHILVPRGRDPSGLRLLVCARNLDSQKDRGLWGREWCSHYFADTKNKLATEVIMVVFSGVSNQDDPVSLHILCGLFLCRERLIITGKRNVNLPSLLRF